ncbi:Deazaflavin-dependent nitroreductase [Mycobacteroides abscessus subsp. abscessus]|uniref:nitroreductase/quinone reductase family protein n=1 Tax=Mycobacteroides abscessus TaxID=36809 RepID=UPI0009287315|nr:nitroreductase/quinone reductase family protein [Mycobacteroides abscessus]SIL80546.1 Deazaflavin-dependent nitroreductase [Mycobacteroides abscessus subsp. abscessus]SLF08403.1 Deazaflavin-dependent nitroreductase [Mycobacteroides abscessus subsp. abscessus]
MEDLVFPESVWGEGRVGVRRRVMGLASSRLTAAIARFSVPIDRFVLTKTMGRYTAMGPIGMPLLVLTTLGRKSGAPRRQPLTYVRDGARLVVVGTNFGQAHHPAWTSNLLAEPHAEVTVGGQTIAVIATQLHGRQHQRFLREFAEIGQNYAAYTARAGREIRVFALERVGNPYPRPQEERVTKEPS